MVDLVNRSHESKDGKNHRKPFKWILIDSAIIGGVAMAASMPSWIPGWPDLWIMTKAFIGAFLLQLAIERGLKRKSE